MLLFVVEQGGNLTPGGAFRVVLKHEQKIKVNCMRAEHSRTLLCVDMFNPRASVPVRKRAPTPPPRNVRQGSAHYGIICTRAAFAP